MKELNREGHTQAVIAGVYPEDEILLPPDVERFFVYFHTEELPFAIAGMSDEMPYESTVYRTYDRRDDRTVYDSVPKEDQRGCR